jgi:arsenite-transporting ATPase
MSLRRSALEPAFQELAAAVGADAAASRAAELLELAPPGLDELFGLLTVMKDIVVTSPTAGRYDQLIVDTAPTGHTLRLLELPAAAVEWVHTFMRIVLKYRQAVRPGTLATELVTLSQQLRTLLALIHDPAHTRFVVVTRAADLPRRETERLRSDLRRLRLDVPFLVVNARTLDPRRCARCGLIADVERRELGRLRRSCGGRRRGCVIIQAPLAAPPPRGGAALVRWSRSWSPLQPADSRRP